MNADEQERIMKQNDKDYGNWVCVVRCKDCIHFNDYNDSCEQCWGGLENPDEDEFCSRGERKETE